MLSFDTHFTSNLPPVANLKKIHFLSKNNLFFQRKPILYVLRNPTISVAFYGKLAIFCGKIANSELDTNVELDIINWQKRKKNVRFQRFEWMIFLLFYKYGRKIIKGFMLRKTYTKF